MKRLGKLALLLVPVLVFVVACFKTYRTSQDYWPLPALPDDDRLLRHSNHILVALVGLFAPLPMCMASAVGLRKRRAGADEVGLLVAQLFVLVAVELSVFFGLVALGAVKPWTFVAAHAAVALAGAVLLRRLDGAGRAAPGNTRSRTSPSAGTCSSCWRWRRAGSPRSTWARIRVMISIIIIIITPTRF